MPCAHQSLTHKPCKRSLTCGLTHHHLAYLLPVRQVVVISTAPCRRGNLDLLRKVLVTDPALNVTISYPDASQAAMPMAMVSAAALPLAASAKPGTPERAGTPARATVSTASTTQPATLPVYEITVKCSSCPQAKMQALADLLQPYIKAASVRVMKAAKSHSSNLQDGAQAQ